jgi:hypothetical protein
MVAAAVEPERLLFVDECGVHISLVSIYGYAPRDERLHLPVPRNWGKNTTLLSSMTTGGMGLSLAVEGATTTRVFETLILCAQVNGAAEWRGAALEPGKPS